MILYYVESDTKNAERQWRRTRAEAHALAKDMHRRDPVVVQCDVDMTHEGAVLALQGTPRFTPKAAWSLSPRKGLRPLPLKEIGYETPPPPAPAPEPTGRGPDVPHWLHGRPETERRDCVVRALAVAADVPYARVHAMLLAEGRRPRCGTYDHQTAAVAKRLGLRRHRAGMTIARFLDDVRSVPRLAAFIRGHAFGVVRGVVTDIQSAGRPKQIVKYYWSKD